MSLEIFHTEIAERNLSKIEDYILENFGLLALNTFREEVLELLYTLSFYPKLGKVVSINSAIRGIVLSKQTTVLYTLRDEKLIVLNYISNSASKVIL